jgi:Arc/MetJ-type ribon-helix-helix transcriptional regulator
VREALSLLEERERQRTEFLLTLDEARTSLTRGEGRVITEDSMRQLASEVNERGRARLLAEITRHHSQNKWRIA